MVLNRYENQTSCAELKFTTGCGYEGPGGVGDLFNTVVKGAFFNQ